MKKQKNNSKERQALVSQFQQELLRTQIEIQEQTLEKISQEIHDNIGQALTLAKLNLTTMLPVNDARLEEKVVNSKDIISKVITDLRDLSHSLNAGYVQEMGFNRSVEYEMEMIRKAVDINTVFEIQGSICRLDKQKELILFRIVQETFNNIIKHAEAKNIKVILKYFPGSLEMSISDDGKGIDPSFAKSAALSKGIGLRSMRNRAGLIGGTFDLDSIPGNGTTIRIFLPIETHVHETQRED